MGGCGNTTATDDDIKGDYKDPCCPCCLHNLSPVCSGCFCVSLKCGPCCCPVSMVGKYPCCTATLGGYGYWIDVPKEPPVTEIYELSCCKLIKVDKPAGAPPQAAEMTR